MPSSALSHRYFQNAAAAIRYAPDGDYIALHWTDAKTSPEELQQVYEHALRAMQQHDIRKILSNHSTRPPLPTGVSTWIANEWIPRAVEQAGYTHCAIVENQAALGRLAAQSIGAQLRPGMLAFRYFPSEVEAALWLKAQ